MSRQKVSVRRSAELDINRAVIWYEEQRVGLGREFLAELKVSLRKIAERPNSFPVDYRHARRALLDRFPYKVYFVVPDDDRPVVVIAVLHGAQSPSRLRGRF